MADRQMTYMEHGPRGLRPEDFYEPSAIRHLAGMPYKDYAEFFKDYIADAEDYERYDTRYIASGGTVVKKAYDFGAVVAGKEEKSLDGSLTIPKDEAMTNWVEPTKMENNTWMIVDSIQVDCKVSSRDFAIIGPAGEPTSLAVAGEATNAATNTLLGLVRNTKLSLQVGKDVLDLGRISKHPSAAVITGAFGAVADEGFAQLGNGKPNHLREIIVLEPGDIVIPRLTFMRDVLFPQNVYVEIALCGLMLGAVS